jgi:tetratricopeptide (TPR) repeat protein
LNLGGNASDRGEQTEALATFHECLRLFDLERSRLGRAMTLLNISEVQLLRREPDAAEECALAALQIATEADLVRIQVISHTLLSTADRIHGRLDTAHHHATDALTLGNDQPDLQAASKAHYEAAMLHHMLGDLTAAIEHHRIAHRMASAVPCLHDTIQFSVGLALAEHRLGMLPSPTATERVRWALGRAADVGFRCLEGMAYVALAELLHDAGAHDQAVAHRRQGMTIQHRAGWRTNPDETQRLTPPAATVIHTSPRV